MLVSQSEFHESENECLSSCFENEKSISENEFYLYYMHYMNVMLENMRSHEKCLHHVWVRTYVL